MKAMKAESYSILIQIGTLISVLLGLGLVVWELQEARRLAQVQVTQDGLAALGADISAYYGEHAPQALARACFTPQEVSEEDMLTLHYLWGNRMMQPFRRRIHARVGGFDIDWRQGVKNAVTEVAMFPAGRAWLLNFESADEEYQALVRGHAADVETVSCDSRMQVFRKFSNAAA